MRGHDTQEAGLFSYLSPEARVPATHPLRPIRHSVDTALVALSPQLETLYARTGRPSIAPEKLLRALLLQVLYSLRSERLLMEELQYNLLFRWFVGLDLDAPVWDVTVFTKNRDRLLAGEVATAFFEQVLAQAKARRLLSDEHFTVDGTLIEAWAGRKSFKPKGQVTPPPDDPGNPSVDSGCCGRSSSAGCSESAGSSPSPRRSITWCGFGTSWRPPHEPTRLGATTRTAERGSPVEHHPITERLRPLLQGALGRISLIEPRFFRSLLDEGTVKTPSRVIIPCGWRITK